MPEPDAPVGCPGTGRCSRVTLDDVRVRVTTRFHVEGSALNGAALDPPSGGETGLFNETAVPLHDGAQAYAEEKRYL